MNNELNFKELYSVSLKATYPIEVGNYSIEPGETIASFDKIQIANFQEIKNIANASGGFDNRTLITWESTKEIRISLIQGIFSKVQFALMSNSNLIEKQKKEKIKINVIKEFESDAYGRISVARGLCKPIFVYDKLSGKKITNWTQEGDAIQLTQSYKDVIIDYYYEYDNDYTILQIGQQLTTGFLSLTGRIKVKDDTTGKVVTGIIKIPKLRLMSDLSIRVGSDAIPQVGRLDAIAVPEGARGQSKVMEIIFLSDDIDADM